MNIRTLKRAQTRQLQRLVRLARAARRQRKPMSTEAALACSVAITILQERRKRR